MFPTRPLFRTNDKISSRPLAPSVNETILYELAGKDLLRLDVTEGHRCLAMFKPTTRQNLPVSSGPEVKLTKRHSGIVTSGRWLYRLNLYVAFEPDLLD